MKLKRHIDFINENYGRQIPRDFFNESKLLKCLGAFKIQIGETRLPDNLSVSIEEDGDAFDIDLDPNYGCLYVVNYPIIVNGLQYFFGTTYNSKEPYPFVCYDHDDYEIQVLDDKGKLTQEFIEHFSGEMNENYHPGKEIIIRPVEKGELDSFCSNTYGSSAPEQNILDLICNPLDTEKIHGAFEGDKMLGAVSFKDSKIDDYTEVSLIFVDPENRQKEIGKLLIDYVFDNSKNNKLIANPYTDEAEDFFIKIGFKKDEDIDPNDTNTVIKIK